MPEETLKYRVELDASDLSSQLEQLRSQIDSAVGAQADLATAGNVSTMDNLLQAGGFAGGGGEFSSGPGMGMSAMGGQFAPLGADQGGFTQQTNQFMQSLSQTLDNAAERTRLGFSKFNDDFRRIGLMQSPQYPEYGSTFAPPVDEEAVRGRGFFRSVGGAMGFGYDPMSTMSPGAYRRASEQTAQESGGGFLMDNKFGIAGTGIGAAVGSVIPGVGTAIGATVGGLVGTGLDMAEDLILADYREMRSTGLGLKSMAQEQGLFFSEQMGMDMAKDMLARTRTWQGKMEGITMEEMQGNLAMFAESGGFSQTTSVQEFETKVQAVLENTRQVAHSLGVFQDEAVRIMAELESKGIASPSQMPLMAGTMGVLGGLSGMSATDMIGWGVQASEMFVGSGIRAADGFDIAIQSRVAASNLSYGDEFQREAVRQAGGVGAASSVIMEQGVRHMMSGPGMLQVANILGGGNIVEGDIANQMGGAMNFLAADPSNYFRMLAMQGQVVGMMGPDAINTQMMNTYLNAAEQMGLSTDTATMTGFLSQATGMSMSDARLMVENAAMDPYLQLGQNIEGHLKARQDRIDEGAYGPAGFVRAASSMAWDGLKVGAINAVTLGTYYPIKSAMEFTADALREPIQHMKEDIGDWWNGRRRTRYDAITDEGVQQALLTYDDEMGGLMEQLAGRDSRDAIFDAMAMEELNGTLGIFNNVGRNALLGAGAGYMIGGVGALPGATWGAGLTMASNLWQNYRVNTRLTGANKQLFANRTFGMGADSRSVILDEFEGLQRVSATEEQINDHFDVQMHMRTAMNRQLNDDERLEADLLLTRNLTGDEEKRVIDKMNAGGAGAGDFYNTVSQEIFGQNLNQLSAAETIAVNRFISTSDDLTALQTNMYGGINADLKQIAGTSPAVANIRAAQLEIGKALQNAMDETFWSDISDTMLVKYSDGAGGYSGDMGQFLEENRDSINRVRGYVDDILTGNTDFVGFKEKMKYMASDESRYSDWNPVAWALGWNEDIEQDLTTMKETYNKLSDLEITVGAEKFTDKNNDGIWNEGEDFVDENGDGVYYGGKTMRGAAAVDLWEASNARVDIQMQVDQDLRAYKESGATDKELKQINAALVDQRMAKRIQGVDFIQHSGSAYVAAGIMTEESLDELRKSGLGSDVFADKWLTASRMERSTLEATMGASEEGKKQLDWLKSMETDSEHLKKQTQLLNTLAGAIGTDPDNGKTVIQVYGNT